MTGETRLPEWAWALGRPLASGIIRTEPEDFRVSELPLVTPDGVGNHLWLEIEKRGANTNWVARRLAAAAGVKSRDVGFAGMKDRHGVTTQWFSIGLQEANSDDWPNWEIEGVRVLQAQRHGRKLRRGTLAGNRFEIVLRDFDGPPAELAERVERAAATGVPNYFGPQRFGRGGSNVQKARAWLEHGGRIRRETRSIYLSSARSFLFNRVLSFRVEQGNWNRLLDGEIAILDGRRPIFECSLPDAELERRCVEMEIHPTGPLAGRGGTLPVSDAAETEDEALADEQPLVGALSAAGLDAARRALRLRPRALEVETGENRVSLRFELPPGAYATSLLRELVNLRDATIPGGSGNGWGQKT